MAGSGGDSRRQLAPDRQPGQPTARSMRGRISVALFVAAALVIALLVMVKRDLADSEPPPPAPRTEEAARTTGTTTRTAALPNAPRLTAPRPDQAPSEPGAPRTEAAPGTPSLPAPPAETTFFKKLPPIASKAMLREQERAVTPQLEACAKQALASTTGVATLSFVLGKQGNDAAVETTGVDYDGTTLTDEALLTCLRETAREMVFTPVPDSSAIYVTRKIELANGKLVSNKFLDFSRVR